MTALNALIAQAAALGGTYLYAAGHAWVSIGGRHCPFDFTDGCSQPVFECARCGAVDYGEKGGPGDMSCEAVCKAGLHALKRRYVTREARVITYHRRMP